AEVPGVMKGLLRGDQVGRRRAVVEVDALACRADARPRMITVSRRPQLADARMLKLRIDDEIRLDRPDVDVLRTRAAGNVKVREEIVTVRLQQVRCPDLVSRVRPPGEGAQPDDASPAHPGGGMQPGNRVRRMNLAP